MKGEGEGRKGGESEGEGREKHIAPLVTPCKGGGTS